MRRHDAGHRRPAGGEGARRSRRKPVKVLLPVNLRTLFPSRSLRNFASYITPEIDPRTGDYTFSEICAAVHHRMGLENNPTPCAQVRRQCGQREVPGAEGDAPVHQEHRHEGGV